MSEDIADYRAARVGLDAEEFLASPLGQTLQRRAGREIDAATVALIDADPDDRAANVQLRRKINQARDAMQWLLDAIEEGRAAALEMRRTPFDDD